MAQAGSAGAATAAALSRLSPSAPVSGSSGLYAARREAEHKLHRAVNQRNALRQTPLIIACEKGNSS